MKLGWTCFRVVVVVKWMNEIKHKIYIYMGVDGVCMYLISGYRSVGAIGANERPKLVPLIHILLFRYVANHDDDDKDNEEGGEGG